MNKLITSAFVLGSTSSVAVSMCIELAKRGCKRFHLVARNIKKNNNLISILKHQFNAVITQEEHNLNYDFVIDKPFVPKVDEFDLYLITAGYLGKENFDKNDLIETMKITSSNYIGIIPWINEITKKERLFKPGRLWIFSSVAGDRGRPSNYHYGAAKAALTIFSEGLQLSCHNLPFRIRIIKAGYIDSPMTRGKVPNFLCLKPSKLAKILLRRPNKKGIEYLPWWWGIIMIIVKVLPNKFVSKT